MRNRRLLVALLAGSMIRAQPPNDRRYMDAVVRQAELFHQKARLAVSEETLVQRSYTLPAHGHFAIGAAAGPMAAGFFVHEIISQYSIGSLHGDPSGDLLEIREIVAADGRPVQTPAAARKALERDISAGAARIRKQILTGFKELDLVDVATDYGPILLAFTKSGLEDMEMAAAGSSWIGVDEAVVFNWRQRTGGALEFRGRKVARRPMHGKIWLRRPDGLPLRISASVEHEEPKHSIRDDATIDYVLASFGCVTPASVAHRHFVDDRILTENLYTYTPFRLFTTESNIRYTDTSAPRKE